MDRTRAIVLAAAIMSIVLAGTAFSNQFPNPSCPDSVAIRKIQDVAALCHPAAGDTVRGVGGIVVGFDAIPTGFDTYFESSGGGPFTGLDFFTGSVNLAAGAYTFAIGDSIVVEFASTAEFQGMTEVQAPNVSISQPNFVVRKVSSGNPLPPFFVGTTTQLREPSSNTFAEQYEGCLVRISGPLTVARTSASGGLGQANAFLVVSPASPSDSVYIDGTKLTTYVSPPVGASVALVQGILGQATRGYRIMLRDDNDVVPNTPPHLTDAFPLTDQDIKVTFDRDVTPASATNTSNYSLASFGAVNSAVMLTPRKAQLSITNGLGHGALETVTVTGIVGQAAGQAMTTPESRTFVNGVLTAEEIQRANPDSLNSTSTCVDRSRFAGTAGQQSQGAFGTRASMAGIVSARFGTLYYLSDPGNPHRGGVAAFAPPEALALGSQYRLTGQIQEFFGETEFSNITEVANLGTPGVPAAATITVIQAERDTCDYSNSVDDGEDYEGRLITLSIVKSVQRAGSPANGFDVADPSAPDTIFVENLNGVLTPLNPPPLDHYLTVTGIVHFTGGTFRVAPRSYADIVDHGVTGVDSSPEQFALRVAPNPARAGKIRFSLPQAADVELGVYDVAGRNVAILLHGRLPAGEHACNWAGRDADGRGLGPGVFFLRLKADRETRVIRMVYLGR